MSEIFGTDESLIVEDFCDSDLELELSIAVMASDANSESVSTWISKEDAEKLIAHLKTAFNLD